MHLEYKDMQSLVGEIRLIASATGLSAVLWEAEGYLRTKLPVPLWNDTAPILVQAEQQLREYFGSRRRVFDLPLDLSGI